METQRPGPCRSCILPLFSGKKEAARKHSACAFAFRRGNFFSKKNTAQTKKVSHLVASECTGIKFDLFDIDIFDVK
jgi:hypothetical protein